jgi:uncharacterized protein (TIGR03437 family)
MLLGCAGAVSLHAQGACSSNLFNIISSNGTDFPAAGGSTTISWHKSSGGSNSCPSFVTTTAPWLTLAATNSSSTTGSSGLAIGPNLSSAARSGVITVQSSANDSTNFFINQAGTTLTADQTSLTFNAPGGVAPTSQTIHVTASGGAVQFGALPIDTGNWLQVTANSLTAPATLTVSVNPSGLAAGTYGGTIQITGAGLVVPVTVTLTVTSPGPALSFNPASTTLVGPSGSITPQTAAVVLHNTGTAASATTVFTLLSDQSWLSAASAGISTLGPGQSATVTLTANASNLQPGPYTGHITAQGAGVSAILTVNFNVTGVVISALVNPITLTISNGTTKTFAGVEQLTGGGTNVAISVTQGANFLSADSTAQVPGSFGITINATALNPGSYSGALLIQCTGSSCVPVAVQVIITVNPGSAALNFTPTGETLALTAGSSTPQTLGATLENDGTSATSFTISSDQVWLAASPMIGNLTPGQKTMISIATSSTNLAPGSYTGHVFAQGTGTIATFTVSLTVNGANVTVTPNPLSLALPAATRQTFPGVLQLAGDYASVAISVTLGNAYLTADTLSQSPGAFSVTVDATRLTPGTYPGALLLRCTPGCAPLTVSISITVTAGSTNFSFGTPSLSLSGNAGSVTPQSVLTTLLNAGNGPGSYTLLTDQPWLSVSPATGTLSSGQTINITVSAASQYLTPGTYTGHVTIGPAVLTVYLSVVGVALSASPNPAIFTLGTGIKQTFNSEQVLGGSGLVNISVTSGAGWLSSDATVQAPGSFNITIDATNLKPGYYSGTLSFTCQTACVAFSLPVNVNVTSNASLVFSPPSVTFTSYLGRSAPAAQTVSVKSSDGSAISFTVNNPFSWLNVSALSGKTPATLTLTPNLTGITSGASGNLTFSTTNTQSSVLLPVMLNITPFSISAPASVTIYAMAGQHAQGSVSIGTADNGPASLLASTSDFWLSVPATLNAPGALPIKVDATSLNAMTYPGIVTVSCATANLCQPLQLTINVVVTNTPILLSDTQSIAFPSPSAQVVHLTSSDNTTAINYSIVPASLPGWLSVSTNRLSTPATLIFSVPNPPAQAATANVMVNSSYGSVVIVVTYTPPTGPVIDSVVSAGGFENVIRPGSWATIYGTGLSTTNSRDWNSGDFNGNYFPTSLDGVSVTVAGKPAFVRSIAPTQINFQCPTGIGTGSVAVTVTNRLGTSNSFMATVADYAPAFFIGLTLGGRNYLAATESANGGVIYIGPANTPGVRPAKDGENLTLWGTGFGPTTPDVPAGSLFSGAATLNDPVTIFIDGAAVIPQFAGQTAAGLYQFNIVVPNLSSGDHQVTAAIGGVTTASGIWLSTQ